MPTKDQQATITETYGSEIAGRSRVEVERSDKSREHAKADAKRREGGRPQLPSFRQGWAGVFIRLVRVTGIQCTLRGKESEVGEKKGKSRSRVLPAKDHAVSYAKESPVIKRKARMNVYRRRDSEPRVEGIGRGRCPMAKASKRRLQSKATSVGQKRNKETYEKGANKTKTSYMRTHQRADRARRAGHWLTFIEVSRFCGVGLRK